MNLTLEKILTLIQLGTFAAAEANKLTVGDKDVQTGTNLTNLLIGIAQKANEAHVEQTGKPIDLDLLHRIEPLD
jgi:hypothetical protein